MRSTRSALVAASHAAASHAAVSARAAARAAGARRRFSAAPTEKLWIFDTTMRDGEQSPGATLTVDEKVCGMRMRSRAP